MAIVDDRQLAAEFCVKPITIRRAARAGKIPYLRLSRKIIRFDMDAVRAAMGKCPGAPAPRPETSETGSTDMR
jgi:predicted site-specific integrase-resolvase